MESIIVRPSSGPSRNGSLRDVASIESRIKENSGFLNNLKTDRFQNIVILMRSEGVSDECLLNFLIGKASLEECFGSANAKINYIVNTYGGLEVRSEWGRQSHFLSGWLADTLSTVFKPGYFESAEKTNFKLGKLIDAILDKESLEMTKAYRVDFLAGADLNSLTEDEINNITVEPQLPEQHINEESISPSLTTLALDTPKSHHVSIETKSARDDSSPRRSETGMPIDSDQACSSNSIGSTITVFPDPSDLSAPQIEGERIDHEKVTDFTSANAEDTLSATMLVFSPDPVPPELLVRRGDGFYYPSDFNQKQDETSNVPNLPDSGKIPINSAEVPTTKRSTNGELRAANPVLTPDMVLFNPQNHRQLNCTENGIYGVQNKTLANARAD